MIYDSKYQEEWGNHKVTFMQDFGVNYDLMNQIFYAKPCTCWQVRLSMVCQKPRDNRASIKLSTHAVCRPHMWREIDREVAMMGAENTWPTEAEAGRLPWWDLGTYDQWKQKQGTENWAFKEFISWPPNFKHSFIIFRGGTILGDKSHTPEGVESQ